MSEIIYLNVKNELKIFILSKFPSIDFLKSCSRIGIKILCI